MSSDCNTDKALSTIAKNKDCGISSTSKVAGNRFAAGRPLVDLLRSLRHEPVTLDMCWDLDVMMWTLGVRDMPWNIVESNGA